MGRRKNTKNHRRHNGVRNGESMRETASSASWGEPEEVEDRRSNSASSAIDQTAFGKDKPDLTQSDNVEPSINIRHDEENGSGRSDFSDSAGALELCPGRTLDVDREQETDDEEEEEDRLGVAIGGPLEEDFETRARLLNGERGLVLCVNSIGGEEITPCFTCGNRSLRMKRCRACQVAFYCDKTCQRRDWKRGHRKSCGNYKLFMANISNRGLIRYEQMFGSIQIMMSLKFIKHPVEALLTSFWLGRRPKQFMLLQIVARCFHLFRHGCFVQDVHGNQTRILFFTGPLSVLMPIVSFPLPFEHFLTPGKFIWLVDPVWHRFVDGTVGVRIDHPRQFELP